MKFDREVKQNIIFMAVGCAVCSVLVVLGALLPLLTGKFPTDPFQHALVKGQEPSIRPST